MSEAADIAADLRADGQAMTLTRTTYSGGDAAAGDPGTPIVQTWTVYGITKNYHSVVRASSYNGAGSLIMAGDRMAMVDAATVEPLPGDNLTIRGVKWTVITVDPVDPQGVALMYTCQVRR